jgi:anaerobic ribonucleoside-triphosphate reductase activating protein
MIGVRLHSAAISQDVNGPGRRYTLWFQGCSLACHGCFNPPSHSFSGDSACVTDVARKINAQRGIRGVTLTGGEPLQQPKALVHLLSLLDPGLDTLLFSGYSLAEVKARPLLIDALVSVDAALLGRYDSTLSHPFQGKSLVLLGDRISASELRPHRNTEILLNTTGGTITGLPSKAISPSRQ